jgi:hypothetical protein
MAAMNIASDGGGDEPFPAAETGETARITIALLTKMGKPSDGLQLKARPFH